MPLGRKLLKLGIWPCRTAAPPDIANTTASAQIFMRLSEGKRPGNDAARSLPQPQSANSLPALNRDLEFIEHSPSNTFYWAQRPKNANIGPRIAPATQLSGNRKNISERLWSDCGSAVGRGTGRATDSPYPSAIVVMFIRVNSVCPRKGPSPKRPRRVMPVGHTVAV